MSCLNLSLACNFFVLGAPRMEQRGIFTEDEVRHVVGELLDALSFIHSVSPLAHHSGFFLCYPLTHLHELQMELAHGNIKGQNVLCFTDDDNPLQSEIRLTSFGRAFDVAAKKTQQEQQQSTLEPPPGFSDEDYEAVLGLGYAVDLFGVGALTYRMLTGKALAACVSDDDDAWRACIMWSLADADSALSSVDWKLVSPQAKALVSVLVNTQAATQLTSEAVRRSRFFRR